MTRMPARDEAQPAVKYNGAVGGAARLVGSKRPAVGPPLIRGL
jgi:hypothetical protein